MIIQGAGRGIGGALARAVLQKAPDVEVLATSRSRASLDGLCEEFPGRVRAFELDVRSESSMAAFGREIAGVETLGAVYCAGVLVPERRVEDIELAHMQEMFEVNVQGALLFSRVVVPSLCDSAANRGRRGVFAAISARVGSSEDNRLGGWYSYRSSKAALNSVVRTLSLEIARRSKGHAIAIAIHPGTVATSFTAPFRASIPKHTLRTPKQAASDIAEIILHKANQTHSGKCFDYHLKHIPF